MSKSINQAFKKNKSDELFTPKILVEILKPYLENWNRNHVSKVQAINEILKPEFRRPTEPIIWCPFDTFNSEFVIIFEELGYEVTYSHISTGQDFFKYEPKHWDIAISNPPFSRKLDVYKRLNSFKKPWAMITNTMALNYMEIGNYFADNPIQMLIPDKRVSFDGNPSSFNSSYICKDFLPKDLMFVHLPHCNSGKDYIPSRMYEDFNV